MRIDKKNPYEEYKDFWDWLVRPQNTIFVLNLAIAYIFYQFSTEEM